MGNLIRKLFGPPPIESEEKRINDRISKLDPNLSPQERKEKEKEIKASEKKISLEKKKKKVSVFNPVSLFIDRTPKELDERVKKIVKAKLKKNPKMSDEELTQLISETTIVVVNDLASECQEEYKIAKTILSPKYGNGKWPTKKELEKLINEKNFPWPKTQINIWPEEKDITSCSVLMTVKDKIMMNNLCIYSDNYNNIIKECDAECGKGLEIRSKKVLKETNSDFPTIQPCSVLQKKEFICDSGKICKEDCKIEIDFKSFGEAKCSKPCDSGDGPGEKTYKIKYLKSSKGEPGNMGSCDLDETDKKEGESYDVTVPCNKDKCPACKITSKGPYKDDTIDYTKSVVMKGKTVPYTACLLPKEDGTFKNVDCGGAEGGFNYTKGARSKYSVMYNVTEDDDGVQNCTKGQDVVEEPCSINAFSPNMETLVKDGEIVKGGGDPCGNECVLSEDYPRLVLVNGKECSKECGGGKRRMRKIVKAKGDAPYCPCKNDPSKCPYEEVDCNTEPCIADCEYTDNGKHVQINDHCPGVPGGVNQDIVWDTVKEKWYDPSEKKYYPRNHFMQHMRVPTKKPPIGKGLCYQGDKADRHLNCRIDSNDLKRPIDGEWGPWEFKGYTGIPNVLQSILPEYKKWDDPSNPNLQSKIEKRIQDRIAVQEKDPVTGETLTEDRIREEENHCVSEEYLSVADLPLPGIKYTRELKKLEDGNPGPRYGGKPAPGPFTKTIPYMKKDDGTYTRYCPVNAMLVPDVWEGDGNQIGPSWDEDKCYVEGRADKGGNVRSEKYTVKQLEDEAKKKFVRDSNLPDYTSPRTGENRIIGPGTRTIFRTKTRGDALDDDAKYGGLPTGKWHSTTGDQKSFYDRRNTEYDECDGVRTILGKINKKIDNTPDWKSNDTYVIQQNCSPVYDWDGKYYISQIDAQKNWDGKTKVETKTHNDTGRVELSDTEKKKYPSSIMRKTTNGKFLTNDMHSDCQKPGLDSNTAWCGEKSTDDFIQMITVSGGLEMIKGVVTKGRGDNEQWVKTFEVYVSRNSDSWQQVKDASGNLTFTGNTDQNTAKENYFQKRVEAKYIRFVTKTWQSHNSMRIGYIKDLSGTIDCNGGDGMLKGEPWYRLTFNKQKTIQRNGMSQGTHSTTKQCPADGTSFSYQRGKSPVTGFVVNELSIPTGVADLQTSMNNLTSSFGTCGKDAIRKGWYNSTAGTSTGWSDCYKTKSAAQTQGGKDTKAVCVDDDGHNYKFNLWTSVSTSDYKPWKPKGNYDDYSPSDKVSHLHNVRRKECFRKKCHILPKYTTEIWTSTHATGSGGNKSKIMNLADKGTDGFVGNTAYSWPFFNNSLLTAVAKHWDINVGYSTEWKMNNYKIQELEGCCDGMDNKNSYSSNWRGRSNTKIGSPTGWHSVNPSTKNLIYYKLKRSGGTGSSYARKYCEDKGYKWASRTDIDTSTWSYCAAGMWSDYPHASYHMTYKHSSGWCGIKGWNRCCGGDYGQYSPYCSFDGVKKNRTDNKFVYFRFNLANEIQINGSMIPVGIKLQPISTPRFAEYWPGSIRIDELNKTITLPTPSNRDQIFLYTFSHDDREILKNGNIHIYPSAGTIEAGHVSIRTNLLYGVEGEGHSIEKINI